MLVNVYATLRQVTGAKTVSLVLPHGGDVQCLLDALLTRFPALRSHLFAPEGGLYPHVHVFVNGRDVQYLPLGLTTPLGLDDNVSIFPAVGGGAA
jgi:MoaD family protein